ncbi:hypothetical protein DH2020_025590 [Rehmannia glutinosa]|uniref:Uncharacterized protein n=1 Tax=Rehmannia glutinosa TaxID=99300 RepID=A0ABR0VZD4_REHGL
MGNLRVLDLFKTGINSLPSYISTLANLVSLYLNDCSSLAELLPLEVKMPDNIELFDIRGTLLGKLPNQIGTMCNLRCLRVSLGQKGCNHNIGEEVEIPPGTITSELASLEKLSTLFIHFPSISSLQIFVTNSISWKNTQMNWENNTFRFFKFFIGCCERQHPYSSDVSRILASRQLGFSTDEEIPPINDRSIDDISPVNDQVSSVDQVLKHASAFELVGNSVVESLSEFDLTNA